MSEKLIVPLPSKLTNCTDIEVFLVANRYQTVTVKLDMGYFICRVTGKLDRVRNFWVIDCHLNNGSGVSFQSQNVSIIWVEEKEIVIAL